jgi:hypothetical protein
MKINEKNENEKIRQFASEISHIGFLFIGISIGIYIVYFFNGIEASIIVAGLTMVMFIVGILFARKIH